MENIMTRMLVVIIFCIASTEALADTNHDTLYITKSNITEYQINVEVVKGDLMFDSYRVKIDAKKHIRTTCNSELREVMVQIGNSQKILMAFPIMIDSKGLFSYSFDIDTELIATSTITLLYGKNGKKSDCDIDLGSPVVIELEDWIN
jgi:hypothetical protein